METNSNTNVATYIYIYIYIYTDVVSGVWLGSQAVAVTVHGYNTTNSPPSSQFGFRCDVGPTLQATTANVGRQRTKIKNQAEEPKGPGVFTKAMSAVHKQPIASLAVYRQLLCTGPT